MGILIAIIVFSFIVIIHELGHFLLARANGIDVYEFSLGMGPLLLSKEYKGTKFSLRLLPIGGACMMGEDEEATGETGNFHSKSVWARMSVILAGPVFNFILAFLLSVILTLMVGYDQPVIAQVVPDSPAEEVGLEAGDRIVRMGNKKINVFREISVYNQFHQGEAFELTYVRDGEEYQALIQPKLNEEYGIYQLGITRGENQKAGILKGIQYGLYDVKYWICTTISSLKMMITGHVGLNEMAGPVGIVGMMGDTYQQSVKYGIFIVIANMLNIAILLSANLGVMNLLPIPALDGGRFVFLLVEAIRRKKVDPDKEGYVHFIGFACLMVLMIFLFFNDIRNLFL